MQVAVRFYKDVPNRPADIPDAWPAEVRQLVGSHELPGPEWVSMTCSDLATHKQRLQPVYDLWKAAQPQEPSVSGEE